MRKDGAWFIPRDHVYRESLKRGLGVPGGHPLLHDFCWEDTKNIYLNDILMVALRAHIWERIWEKGPIGNLSCHEI